jgi:hypothetical protein
MPDVEYRSMPCSCRVLLLSGLVLAPTACGGEPSAAELSAAYDIERDATAGPMLFSATFTSDGELPELTEDGTLTVDGLEQTIESRQDGELYLASGEVPALPPGEPFDIVLDLPSQEGITVSLPMPAAVVLQEPGSGSVLQADLHVLLRWSGEASDELTYFYLAAPGGRRALLRAIEQGSEEVDGVATHEHFVAADELFDSLARVQIGRGLEDIAFPFDARLSMRRARVVSSSPPFAGGRARVATIAADIPVTFVDPSGSAATSIRKRISAGTPVE